MIRHIVFFSAKESADLERIRTGLSALGKIRHHRHFEVAENRGIDPYGNEIDIVVYAEFESWEAFAAYKADPIYENTTAAVRPMRELRFSADYEVAG